MNKGQEEFKKKCPMIRKAQKPKGSASKHMCTLLKLSLSCCLLKGMQQVPHGSTAFCFVLKSSPQLSSLSPKFESLN
ncbi:hypothetical protein DUNSADRAFT_6783 [Dunaliella salina]|uniref:Encoded protein n=1 Tax=Dunaliella salina TaxID=3046 RepID=A0ABQ7GMM0_DUNSA|nr:hypothetical protein DUNSADRAFT_6783 [Dunaliella salina]|eukprot:KAF5835850.1 hypothetical protein DUNSADRAFT_6783 [Dunaliella salina]